MQGSVRDPKSSKLVFVGLQCRDVKWCLARGCLVQGVNVARNPARAVRFKPCSLTLVCFHSDEGELFFHFSEKVSHGLVES